MAVTSFIPKIWSARLLDNLRKTYVYANLFNTDYEGEISAFGDTVHINSLTDIAIKKYSRNTDIDAPEQLTTSDQTLVIDQGDYYNFGIDDVDKAQIRADLMDKAMASAAYGLAGVVDEYCAKLLSTAEGVITKDLGSTGTPLQVADKGAGVIDPYTLAVRMAVAMDKANVPEQGRVMVVPPEFKGYIQLDPRFASNNGGRAEQVLANGKIAEAAGFSIYISNNVPNTGSAKYKITAFREADATFAEQLIKTEAYRPEKRFNDAVKGLHVYGAKITRPAAIAVATVNFGAAGA